MVVVKREGSDWVDTNKRAEIKELASQLQIEGVTAVRNVTNPLGEKTKRRYFRHHKHTGAAGHRRSTAAFVSQAPKLAGDVASLN